MRINKKIIFFIFLSLIIFPTLALGAEDDVSEIYTYIGNWYQSFFLPVGTTLAGFVIMYGGIVYATSGGDTSKVAKGKELIFGAVSGLALLILAVFIVRMITT